jgi:hypothetical protein
MTHLAQPAQKRRSEEGERPARDRILNLPISDEARQPVRHPGRRKCIQMIWAVPHLICYELRQRAVMLQLSMFWDFNT